MFTLLPRVQPQFRQDIDNLMADGWSAVVPNTMHLLDVIPSNLPDDYFAQYIAEEEQWLSNNLNQINYDLQESDTVRALIDGPLERVSEPIVSHQILFTAVATFAHSCPPYSLICPSCTSSLNGA